MNRRHARLIRAGIRAARNPELAQHVHLAPRLVRQACRRELENMQRCAEQWDGWSMPQRAAIGVDPATATTEQTEHLRRFYA